MTHDLLDDLVRDVPRHVRPDVDRAWRAGTRRKRRSLAARAAGGVVVTLVAATALAGIGSQRPVAPADTGDAVSSHPTFVARPILMADLPERPGPMAAVLVTDVAGVVVVDGDGRSWRLPGLQDGGGFIPSLSRDGRRIGFMEPFGAHESQFVILDLMTGARTEFPSVGDNIGDATQTYMMFGQTPSYWSPDGRWLMTHAKRTDGSPGNIALGVDGEIRVLDDLGRPAGWVSNDRLGWLTDDGRLVVSDLDSSTRADVRLEQKPSGDLDQWSAQLSPDGTQLAVSFFARGRGVLETYDVGSGRARRRLDIDRGLFSPPVWVGSRVATWTSRGLVDAVTGSLVIEYSSHWADVLGGQWASDALAGEDSSGPGLLAWPYWQWLWWWHWLVVASFAVALLLVLLWSYRRGSRRDEARDTVDWWGGGST